MADKYNIPKEKFAFIHEGERISDKKFEDKPIGYFKDAWIRFRKSRASVVAAIIIIAIVLYSLVMPLVKPAWLTLMITVFQSVWNTGASGYVYSENLKTFDESINNIISASGTQGAGSAAAVIMMSVPIIVFLISQSKIVETMGSSGMKD